MRKSINAPERYDVWVNPDVQNQQQLTNAVAALSGWDPSRARKVIESESPIRRRILRREALYLCRRFADLGFHAYTEPDLPELPDETPNRLDPPEKPSPERFFYFAQAFLGLAFGGITAVVVYATDPLGVTVGAWMKEMEGSDPTKRIVSFDQWSNSTGILLGQLAMAWIPLLVSGLCGVFAHRSLPASALPALLRMTGITSVLLLVKFYGAPVVEQAFETGHSSDFQGAIAFFVFAALCISLAAPLSSAVTRRRSP
jgi:hypothetical protein